MQNGIFSGIGPKNYQRSDQRIYEDAVDRLSQHGKLDVYKVELEVKNGEVKGNGTDRNRYDKRLVEEIIDTVPRVMNIQNHLRFTSSSSTG
jgi:osmotically-inducible protein OsmY